MKVSFKERLRLEREGKMVEPFKNHFISCAWGRAWTARAEDRTRKKWWIKRERKNQGREGWSNLKKGRERWPIKWKRKNLGKITKSERSELFVIFPRFFLFHFIGHPFVLFSDSVVPLLLDSSFPSLFFVWCCYVILLCYEWILLCDIVILLCDMFIWYYYMILYSSLNQCDVVMGWSFLYNIQIIFVSFWDHCGFLFG